MTSGMIELGLLLAILALAQIYLAVRLVREWRAKKATQKRTSPGHVAEEKSLRSLRTGFGARKAQPFKPDLEKPIGFGARPSARTETQSPFSDQDAGPETPGRERDLSRFAPCS
jgi:hypothetical protein